MKNFLKEGRVDWNTTEIILFERIWAHVNHRIKDPPTMQLVEKLIMGVLSMEQKEAYAKINENAFRLGRALKEVGVDFTVVLS